MIEKFNGIFYLVIFIIHFVGFGAYAYQMIIGNQKFRAKFEIDETAATIMRMAGAIFFGSFLMALYIMFVRPNGVEGTWAFFNLIFVQNIFLLILYRGIIFEFLNLNDLSLNNKQDEPAKIGDHILLLHYLANSIKIEPENKKTSCKTTPILRRRLSLSWLFEPQGHLTSGEFFPKRRPHCARSPSVHPTPE